MNVRKFLINIIEDAIAFLLIVGNYSMIERDNAIGISEIMLTCCVCALSILLPFFYGATIYIKKHYIGYLFAAMVLSIGMIAAPGANITLGLMKWMLPLLSFSICVMMIPDSRTIWLKFADIVYLLAVVSLFLYLFGSIFHFIQPTGTATYLYNFVYKRCDTYFRLLYEAQRIQNSSLLSIVRYRNCGIFIEAPMYNLVLCLAMVAEITFSQKPRKRVLAVLAVTILSTFSTTGLIFLVLIGFMYLLFLDAGNMIKVIKFFIIPFVFVASCYLAYYLIQSKTQSLAGANSYSIRTDHIVASLKMLMDRPLFGFGFGNSDAFYKYVGYEQGFSVGLPALLGRNGLLAFSIYIIPFINCIRVSVRKSRRDLFFLIGTFALFFMTASVYKTVFLFLVANQIFWKDGNAENYMMQEKNEKASQIIKWCAFR